jgi:hypothetical protein
MPHKFLIPLLTAVFLAAPAFVHATMLSLSGSALAQKTPETNALNLNSSRSNTYRMGGGVGVKTTPKSGIAVSDPGVPNDPTPKKKTK